MNYFEELYKLNVNDNVEEKNGLKYLSWAWAIAEILKKYPDMTYEILRFENNLPYTYDEKTGYMVFTKVTIQGITREMWLPVMDSANKSMLDHPYTYNVKKKEWDTTSKKYVYTLVEKNVEAATMFDINKTIMRCLTKNLAMFGLGLYIYAGEDLPEEEVTETKVKTTTKKTTKEIKALPEQVETIANGCGSEENIKKLCEQKGVESLADLTIEQASEIIKKLNERSKKEGNENE